MVRMGVQEGDLADQPICQKPIVRVEPCDILVAAGVYVAESLVQGRGDPSVSIMTEQDQLEWPGVCSDLDWWIATIIDEYHVELTTRRTKGCQRGTESLRAVVYGDENGYSVHRDDGAGSWG